MEADYRVNVSRSRAANSAAINFPSTGRRLRFEMNH
jgi:hypothetical protein